MAKCLPVVRGLESNPEPALRQAGTLIAQRIRNMATSNRPKSGLNPHSPEYQVSETSLTDLKKKVPDFTDDLEAGVGSQLHYHQASPCFHPSQKSCFL